MVKLITHQAITFFILLLVSASSMAFGKEGPTYQSYFLSSAKWQINTISVCWENPSEINVLERDWVRLAVLNTWEKYAAISFVGWKPCNGVESGINILINDENPHVKGLGVQLSGLKHGMVLDFTFNNFSPDACIPQKKFCIEAVAVHEFGHALGLLHEHDRPESPGRCDDKLPATTGGISLTRYDPDSVMNYCNKSWNGNGKLSGGDIEGIRKWYGSRSITASNDFDIGQYYVPSGYQTELGSWISGDVNGDKKTDLIHIVKEYNYIHIWKALKDDKYEITKILPPPDYYIDRGSWVTADFNGDGRTDLIHLVADSNYIHTWKSLSNGQFEIGKFSAPSDYQVGLGSWVAGDFNGDGKTDLIHIVVEKNYIHPWKSLGNGQFEIGKVLPPPGYQIGRGTWVAADFNGDGKSDLIHLVSNSNYIHTWKSLGNGQFEIGKFSAPSDYQVERGSWLAADFNGDGKTDLVHLVNDTNYIHPWKSLGDGQFEVGQFFAPSGYQIERGTWVAADFNGDGKTDLVHFVKGANYIHPWTAKGR